VAAASLADACKRPLADAHNSERAKRKGRGEAILPAQVSSTHLTCFEASAIIVPRTLFLADPILQGRKGVRNRRHGFGLDESQTTPLDNAPQSRKWRRIASKPGVYETP
jgi:hypothetical protein